MGYGYPFAGTVRLEGEPIAEFSGEGVQDFDVTVDASEYPPLSSILVGIHIEFIGGFTREYLFEYTISDEIPTRNANLSVLKILYR